MEIILGLTDGDDGGAALLVDGKLVAAINEERLNRMKMSIGFPTLAIPEVLRIAGINAKDITHVAVAAHTERFRPIPKPYKGWFAKGSFVDELRNSAAALFSKPLGKSELTLKLYRKLKRASTGRRKDHVTKIVRENGIDAPISYHNHHRCHALAAYECSGFDDALSVSLDGGGDGSSSFVYTFDTSSEERVNQLDSMHSIGNFYSYVTHMCGFRAGIHEGKITGLSARGKPIYIDIFRKLIKYSDGKIENVSMTYRESAIKKLEQLLPSDWQHHDLAASIQKHLEEVAVPYIQYWLQKTKKRNICLSGGVFANVKLNQCIANLEEVDDLFVYPAMGDGGLAAGAAFSARREANGGKSTPKDSIMTQAYLGSSFTDEEIETALKDQNVSYTRYDDIEKVIAHLIHEGKVVARFNGAMEYGPRALCNRTIMYHTREPEVNQWLNKRLNRTEFMPFAPACLAGTEEKLFKWNKAAARATRFMTITLDCTDWMKEKCPAVVHIDGTARPQIVDKETNPSAYKVIEYYNELSGIPVIVNTSFNMHEEPIVCSPADAVRAYQLGKLDNLALGGAFLLGDPPASLAKG